MPCSSPSHWLLHCTDTGGIYRVGNEPGTAAGQEPTPGSALAGPRGALAGARDESPPLLGQAGGEARRGISGMCQTRCPALSSSYLRAPLLPAASAAPGVESLGRHLPQAAAGAAERPSAWYGAGAGRGSLWSPHPAPVPEPGTWRLRPGAWGTEPERPASQLPSECGMGLGGRRGSRSSPGVW